MSDTSATSNGSTGVGTDVSQLGFEQAQAELETIVEKLEDPHTGLDEALTLWERGEALHHHCQEKLDYAAARIETIRLSTEEIADAAGPGDEFTPEAPSGTMF